MAAKYQALKKRVAKIPTKGKEITGFKAIWGSYETHSLIEKDSITKAEWEAAHKRAIGWSGKHEQKIL